ncbi:transmembrane and coiled-coil domain-containing protein 4-like [Lytechinus pictus]|uniref:transmembrane and coiled-coil domain-containing protein 4-like n=1 Tax=Lytechinus pictus TaxID=7653 RepID=UPI0030B9F3C8
MENKEDTTNVVPVKADPVSPKELDSPSEASSSGISSQEELPGGNLKQAAEDDPDDETYQTLLQQGLKTFSEGSEESSRNPSNAGSPGRDGGQGGVGDEREVGDDVRDGAGVVGAMSSSESEDSSLSSLAEEQLKKPLPELLSDVAKFSYSSLVAVCLPNLFENEWNKQWNLKMVKSLSKYLQLPKQSGETLCHMVNDPNHHELANADVFTEVLLEDPSLIKPEIIPKDIITQALNDGTYDARMRVLVREISKRLNVSWKLIRAFEKGIIDVYEQEEHELTEEEKRERDKKAKFRKAKRYVMIGAATVGGGAIIGLTGGLAAPLIATAGAALLGTSLSFFGTVAGAAIIGSILGAAGAGLSGYKMKKRVGEVEEFEFTALTEGRDLHVTVAVSGWLQKKHLDNFTVPWRCVATCNEIYCLKWESKYLIELGEALEYILDTVMTMAAKEALKYTVLSGLLAAIALPAAAYAAISNSIDNPWSIATSRASEAGKQLAEVLLSRQQGKRPVTLVGFSMGARVIFFCLKELSVRKGSEGIVQDVYLLGAPVTSSVAQWRPFARVVAGHIVNGFCRGDWLLQFVYRTASMQVSDIAGLEPVRWDNRRMVNVDLTDVVTGHLDYSGKISTILDYVGLETKDSPTSGNLSDLTKPKTKDTEKTSEDQEPLAVKFDASDLLLPKSGSAMDLALSKLTVSKGHSPDEDTDSKPKTLAENVAASCSPEKVAKDRGSPSVGPTATDNSSCKDDANQTRKVASSEDESYRGVEGGAGLRDGRIEDEGRKDTEEMNRGGVRKREEIEVGEDPLSLLSD